MRLARSSSVRLEDTAPLGCEHLQDSSGNSQIPTEGGAKPGAPDAPKPANTPALYPDLAEVANAWPTLPPAIRAGILAMIQAAKRGA